MLTKIYFTVLILVILAFVLGMTLADKQWVDALKDYKECQH